MPRIIANGPQLARRICVIPTDAGQASTLAVRRENAPWRRAQRRLVASQEKRRRSLYEDILDHVCFFDAGQTLIESLILIGQLLVVDAQLVQNGGI